MFCVLMWEGWWVDFSYVFYYVYYLVVVVEFVVVLYVQDDMVVVVDGCFGVYYVGMV